MGGKERGRERGREGEKEGGREGEREGEEREGEEREGEAHLTTMILCLLRKCSAISPTFPPVTTMLHPALATAFTCCRRNMEHTLTHTSSLPKTASSSLTV